MVAHPLNNKKMQRQRKLPDALCISYECHPDLILEEIFDELYLNGELEDVAVEYPIVKLLEHVVECMSSRAINFVGWCVFSIS